MRWLRIGAVTALPRQPTRFQTDSVDYAVSGSNAVFGAFAVPYHVS